MVPKDTILVVDDEEDIREMVRYNLEREGYVVRCVATGEQAVAAIREKPPSLVVLDLMLPGLDGLQVCRIVKRTPETAAIPIMMLTAKGEESDIVVGLELGADDYVTKPFSPKVLCARVRAILRRAAEQKDESDIIEHGPLVIDPKRHKVLVEGKEVELTASEFRILHLLARKPGWVFTRSQIVNAVHRHDFPVTDRSVDVHVVFLRRKLGSAAELVETVRGVGYRFRG